MLRGVIQLTSYTDKPNVGFTSGKCEDLHPKLGFFLKRSTVEDSICGRSDYISAHLLNWSLWSGLLVPRQRHCAHHPCRQHRPSTQQSQTTNSSSWRAPSITLLSMSAASHQDREHAKAMSVHTACGAHWFPGLPLRNCLMSFHIHCGEDPPVSCISLML